MYRRVLSRGAYTGGLLVLTGVLAWVTGQPFVFPSLGPSAYLLATAPDAPASQPRRVLGGHVLGVVAGLLAYWTLAPGLAITADAAVLATGQFRLVLSGVVSVALTTAAMLATDTGHAPACATTLIVSLGLLAAPLQAAGIVVAVVVLAATHALASRVL
ncbi:HPP family protein [Haloarculaceae archaeon H-GB11]|nr:HPP family protein [Haloarculaceae archaeon H-GB11]